MKEKRKGLKGEKITKWKILGSFNIRNNFLRRKNENNDKSLMYLRKENVFINPVFFCRNIMAAC